MYKRLRAHTKCKHGLQVWRHARVSAAVATFLPNTPALPVPPVPSVSSPDAENPKWRAPSADLCVRPRPASTIDSSDLPLSHRQ